MHTRRAPRDGPMTIQSVDILTNDHSECRCMSLPITFGLFINYRCSELRVKQSISEWLYIFCYIPNYHRNDDFGDSWIRFFRCTRWRCCRRHCIPPPSDVANEEMWPTVQMLQRVFVGQTDSPPVFLHSMNYPHLAVRMRTAHYGLNRVISTHVISLVHRHFLTHERARERCGARESGVEWSGAKWSEVERNGAQRNGVLRSERASEWAISSPQCVDLHASDP